MLDLHGHDERRIRAGMPVELPTLHIQVVERGATRLVVLTGEIDLPEREKLRDRLCALDGTVIVDLDGVTFLGSTGLGILAGARNRLRANGGDLFLRSPQAHIRRVLEITGLDVMLLFERASTNGPSAA
jgi:anti-sigma B factor antagonist